MRHRSTVQRGRATQEGAHALGKFHRPPRGPCGQLVTCASRSSPPIRDVGAIPLPSTMGRTPDIPDAHIPDTVLELPNVAHIHPAPIVADLDLVMGTDFDPT